MKLWQAITKRYKAPEWALFREVGNATGFGCRRHADAVAMNLWPSRGLEIVGIEIKQSRSDWVRERDDPAKSVAVQQFCDRWYLAVTKGEIVLAGEVPVTWGLLVLEGDKLVERKEAPKLESLPMSRAFAAALLRRAAEHAPGDAELKAATNEAHEKGFEAGVEQGKRQVGREAQNLERLREQVAAFEKASGIKISEYSDGEELGEMVTLLRRITNGTGTRSCMNAVLSNLRSIRENTDEIESAAKAMIAAITPERVESAA